MRHFTAWAASALSCFLLCAAAVSAGEDAGNAAPKPDAAKPDVAQPRPDTPKPDGGPPEPAQKPKRKGVKLGVNLDGDKTGGVWVGDVVEGDAADKAGVKAGDKIVKLGATTIAGTKELRSALEGIEELSTQELVVERDGKEVKLFVTFGKAQEASSGGSLHDKDDAITSDEQRAAVAAKLPGKAVEFLLVQQRENGDWSIGFQPSGDPGSGASVGVTALVCMSLLQNYDCAPDRIEKALNKGLEHIKKHVWRKQQGAKDFEFTAWGQLYAATLLTRMSAHSAWKGKAEEFNKERATILDWMYMRQSNLGSWGYRNSFHTAAAILGLLEMKNAGADIRKDVIENSAAFLAKLRQEDGSYKYSAGSGKFTDTTWNDYGGTGTVKAADYRAKDCMGRIGECALALQRAGHLTRPELEDSVALFIKHRDFLNNARQLDGRENNPTGMPLRLGGKAQGAATPYPWFYHFAYYFTAQCLAQVEKTKRTDWGNAMKKDLLAAVNADGTWTGFELNAGNNTAPGNKVLATAFSIMALKSIDAALAAPEVDKSKDSDAPNKGKEVKKPEPDKPANKSGEEDF